MPRLPFRNPANHPKSWQILSKPSTNLSRFFAVSQTSESVAKTTEKRRAISFGQKFSCVTFAITIDHKNNGHARSQCAKTRKIHRQAGALAPDSSNQAHSLTHCTSKPNAHTISHLPSPIPPTPKPKPKPYHKPKLLPKPKHNPRPISTVHPLRVHTHLYLF